MSAPHDLLEAFENLLRRSVEQFFPRAPVSLSEEQASASGVELALFGRRFVVEPPFSLPFSRAEERLIRVIGAVVENRIRQMNDSLTLDVVDAMHVPIEDFVVAEFVDMPQPSRLTAALESLRSAALSTYENREISTGVLLLADAVDPAEPDRPPPPRAPTYDIRLSAIKGFHRLADGLNSLFVLASCNGRFTFWRSTAPSMTSTTTCSAHSPMSTAPSSWTPPVAF